MSVLLGVQGLTRTFGPRPNVQTEGDVLKH